MKLFNAHEELLEHLHNFCHAPFIKDDLENGHCAILLAHFGTTDQTAREKAIEPLNEEVKRAYPELEVREAYTSRIIMKRLKDKGIHKDSLPEALEKLAKEGFRKVLVQPSVIIDGVEMESIVRNVKEQEHLFEEVRISSPLLFHPFDYFALVENLPSDFSGIIVYVGHGTYDSSTAQYPMLQQVANKMGKKNIIVSTIEGYPDLEDLKSELSHRNSKDILLRPLMYVAGVHAKEDIAEDWYNELKNEGYNVSCNLEGLGELASIRSLYIKKIDFSLNYRAWDIMEKKNIYRKTGEKL